MERDETQTLVRLGVGSVIAGKYELQAKIGSGGFATVFRALQLNLQQDVAVKVLEIRGGEDEDFIERFLQEAKTAAQIRHPDIVSMLDFGVTEQGQPYHVLELLNGHSLEEELDENGAMEPARVLKLFVRCLDALDAAHKMGVIHRDLKPANLFLSEPGTMVETLKVLDFGIARVSREDQKKLTQSGQILGTANYLAPEYIESGEVKPAMDVYQMGLILSELLTGQTAVESENMFQTMMKHCSGELNIPRELLHTSLGPVLEKAIALIPTERFQDAGEFRDALAEIDPATMQNYEPTAALPMQRMDTADFPPHTPPTMLAPKLQPKKSNSGLIIAAAGVGLLIAVMLIGIGTKLMIFPSGEAEVEKTEVAVAGEPDKEEVEQPVEGSKAEADGAKTGGEPAAEVGDTEEAVKPAPEATKIVVNATPAGARFYEGEVELGPGPMTFSFSGEESKTLILKADGFEDKTIRVMATTQTPLSIELEPVPKRKARPTTKPKSKASAVSKTNVEEKTKPTKKIGFIDDKKSAPDKKKPKGKIGLFE